MNDNNPRIFNVKLYGAKGDNSTDDTVAIQAAVTACVNAGGGVVWFPKGIYIIGGAIQTSVAGVDMNCQIYIPLAAGNSSVVTVNFIGESSASPGSIMQSPFSSSVFADMGATLYSTYTGTRSTTNKGTAIIGTGEASPGAFNLNSLTLKNINFKTKSNPNGQGPEIGGCNGRNIISLSIDNCTYGLDVVVTSFVTPTRDISGFEFPETGGGASYFATNSSAFGLKWGMIFGEHVSGNQLSCSLCINAFGIKDGGHAATFQRINSYWCVNAISYYAFGANPTGTAVFNVLQLDIEFGVGNVGKYYNSVYGVVDTGNKFLANINYTVITQGVGLNNANWAVNGGARVMAVPVGTGLFGYDVISAYNPATGQVSVVKSSVGGTGYAFTNTNTGAIVHFQAIADAFATEFFQKASATSTYGILVPNSGGLYTTSTAGLAFMVDGNGHIKFSTGTGAPAALRFDIDASGMITPGANVSQDFGSASLAWRDIFLSHLVGESAIGVSSGLGTNVTSLTPSGNDSFFQLTLVTSGNVTGTVGLIAFGRTWGATPKCIISAANASTGAAIAGGYIGINATSSSSLTMVGSIIGAGTYVFNVHCGQ